MATIKYKDGEVFQEVLAIRGAKGDKGDTGAQGGTWTAASQIPLADAGGYFATDNVEAALQEVGGVIKDSSADDGQVLTSDGIGGVAWETPVGGLVARLTVTGNPEIVVSAIDYGTSTFTSAGHTLSNGDKLVSFMNHNVLEAMLQYLPAGMNISAPNIAKGHSYVVNADQLNGTFQISGALGGPPLALTLRGTENFSKWHFEKVNSIITGISGLNGQRFRVVMTGQFSGNINTYWGGLNMNNDISLRTPTSFFGGFGSGGSWAFIFADYIFDSRYRPSVCGSMRVRHQFDTTAPSTLVNRVIVETDILQNTQQNFTITSIGYFTDSTYGFFFANGSTMEVYAC